MKPRDGRLVLAAGLAVAAVTFVPFLYGAIISPPGATFLWGVGFLPDTLGKLSFVSQAAGGSFLFADLYTSEPHPPAFLHPLFLLLGWITRLTGMFPPLVFQLNRLIFVLLLVAALHALCKRLFEERDERAAAFVLVLTSGGPGFLCLLHPLFHSSADVRGAEMTTFFSMYQQGHFTASLFFIVLAVIALMRAAEAGSLRSAAWAGASFLAVTSVHPYDAPVMAAAGGAYLLARAAALPAAERRSRLAGLALFLLIPAPLAAYHALVAAFSPVFSEFSREGLLAPPWPASDYLLGYAPLLLLAAAGFRRAYRLRRAEWLLPAAWLAIVPLLMLAPFPARRKLMEGYHMILCLPAALGLAALKPSLGKLWKPAVAAILILLSGSSFYVMARDMYALNLSLSPRRAQMRMEAGALVFPDPRPIDRLFVQSPWMAGILMRGLDRYYVPDGTIKAIDWIGANTPPDSVVLSDQSTGMIVPMLVPRRVFAGHLFETLRYREKTAAISALMDPVLPDGARRMFLNDNGIRFLLWDSRLEEAGGWRPEGRAWLSERATFKGALVLEVSGGFAVSDSERAILKPRLDACLMKHRGLDLYRAGIFAEAALAFRRSLQIYPGDRQAETLLYEALKRAPPRRLPAGTRGTG